MRTLHLRTEIEPDHDRIGRKVGAILLAPGLFLVSLGLIVAASFQAGESARTNAFNLYVAGGLFALCAATFELMIQRQLHLANHGVVVEATVTERWQVRGKNREHELARYFFATADGKSIEKKCRLGDIEASCIAVNSRILVVYDPEHPKRACRVDDLWAAKLTKEVAYDPTGQPTGNLE